MHSVSVKEWEGGAEPVIGYRSDRQRPVETHCESGNERTASHRPIGTSPSGLMGNTQQTNETGRVTLEQRGA